MMEGQRQTSRGSCTCGGKLKAYCSKMSYAEQGSWVSSRVGWIHLFQEVLCGWLPPQAWTNRLKYFKMPTSSLNSVRLPEEVAWAGNQLWPHNNPAIIFRSYVLEGNNFAFYCRPLSILGKTSRIQSQTRNTTSQPFWLLLVSPLLSISDIVPDEYWNASLWGWIKNVEKRTQPVFTEWLTVLGEMFEVAYLICSLCNSSMR